MEKQSLRGEDQPVMNKIRDIKINRYFCCCIFLFVFLIRGPVFAQGTHEPGSVMPGIPKTGLASAVYFSQNGGGSVLMKIRGSGLSHPRVVPAPGAALVLEWDKTRFPQNTDKQDWWGEYGWDVLMIKRKNTGNWWKEYDIPLIQRVVAVSTDQEGVRLILIGPQRLKLEKIDGMPGSDLLTLILRVDRPDVKSEPPAGPRPLQPGDPMAIRAPVTLEFRDAPVRDIFRMLASLQKLNLVLDNSVPDSSVTLSFNGIPFSEAFSYLLRMNDLTYAMAGGRTLVVGKLESIGRTLGQEITRGYRLAYGDPGQIPGLLTGLVSLSKEPVVDNRMRTIYVTGTEQQHREIAMVIARIDHPGRQVMIHAQIMEVKDDAKQELDKVLTAVYDQWVFSFTGGGLIAGGDYLNRNFKPDFDINAVGGMGMLGKDVKYTNFAPDSGIKMLTGGLKALETSGKGKVLANPSVIAIDGNKANIKLTRDYIYVSGRDDRNNPEYSTQSTGPTLEFTPTIGRDEMVTLDIKIETGEILEWRKSGNAEVPETSKRSVQTIVRVRNGEPFVVGGLRQDNKSKGYNRIPVLGYLPIVGTFFRTRLDVHNRSEVAMVVIPYILDIPETTGVEMHDIPSAQLHP